MAQATLFKAGDRVRHEKRPEWGVGKVQRVESIAIGGKPAQRLTVRFPNGGLKTLSTVGAPLSMVPGPDSDEANNGKAETLVDKEEAGESGWLASISKHKPENAMIELPPEATDPFATLEARLRATLALYRFEPTGSSLIDWAVARSGMDDPLSRFTRHELEKFFERWTFLRDRHLRKMLEDVRSDPDLLERALQSAPPAARRAVGRHTPRR